MLVKKNWIKKEWLNKISNLETKLINVLQNNKNVTFGMIFSIKIIPSLPYKNSFAFLCDKTHLQAISFKNKMSIYSYRIVKYSNLQ